jgi:hypothetical protein
VFASDDVVRVEVLRRRAGHLATGGDLSGSDGVIVRVVVVVARARCLNPKP